MKKYYIYAYLREDRYSPYYIGKGCGDRCYNTRGRNCGIPPAHRIEKVAENLTEEDALALERILILFYGRKCDGGILQNIQEGGAQPIQPPGFRHSEATKIKCGQSTAIPMTLSGRSWKSKSDCAREYGVSVSAVRRWEKKGCLPTKLRKYPRHTQW